MLAITIFGTWGCIYCFGCEDRYYISTMTRFERQVESWIRSVEQVMSKEIASVYLACMEIVVL